MLAPTVVLLCLRGVLKAVLPVQRLWALWARLWALWARSTLWARGRVVECVGLRPEDQVPFLLGVPSRPHFASWGSGNTPTQNSSLWGEQAFCAVLSGCKELGHRHSMLGAASRSTRPQIKVRCNQRRFGPSHAVAMCSALKAWRICMKAPSKPGATFSHRVQITEAAART